MLHPSPYLWQPFFWLWSCEIPNSLERLSLVSVAKRLESTCTQTRPCLSPDISSTQNLYTKAMLWTGTSKGLAMHEHLVSWFLAHNLTFHKSLSICLLWHFPACNEQGYAMDGVATGDRNWEGACVQAVCVIFQHEVCVVHYLGGFVRPKRSSKRVQTGTNYVQNISKILE